MPNSNGTTQKTEARDGASGPAGVLTRHWRWVLVGLFGLTLVLRAIYALEIRGTAIPELWRGRQTDMAFFVSWGRLIAEGDWLTDRALHPYFSWQRAIGTVEEWNRWYGGKSFHQAPLYPYLLACLFRFVSNSVWSAYVVQTLGSALVVVMIAGISRRVFDPLTGLLAGLITAFQGTLLFYDFVALRASLTVLLLVSAVWFLRQASSGTSVWRWLPAGVVLGLGFLLRPNAALTLVLAFPAVGILLWGQWRRIALSGALLALGFTLAIAPLVVRNRAVGVPPLGVSAVGATTFYLANAKGAPGTGWGMIDAFPKVLHETQGRFGSLARAAFASHGGVGSYLDLMLTKLTSTFHYFERNNNANLYFAEHASVLLRWFTIPTWLVLAFGLSGLVLTRRRWRDLLWVYVGALVPLLSILLVYQTARFRLPLIVMMTPFAAAALVWMVRHRRQAVGAYVFTAVACIVIRWPSMSDPPRVQQRDFAAAATVLQRIGRNEAAIEAARQGVARFDSDVRAWTRLIVTYERIGDVQKALEACREALARLPKHGELHATRARLLLKAGEVAPAMEIARRLLQVSPRYVPALVILSQGLRKQGSPDKIAESVELARRAVQIAPQRPASYRELAEALAAANRREDALHVIEIGLAKASPVDPGRAELIALRDRLEGKKQEAP